MGCSSSVDKSNDQVKQKETKKSSQHDYNNLEGQNEDQNQNKKGHNKNKQNCENREKNEQERKQHDTQSQTTPIKAAIKQIFIIPPYDSEGNLVDEIQTLEIKADVQTNLKRQQMNEAKKTQKQPDKDVQNEIDNNKENQKNEEYQQSQKFERKSSRKNQSQVIPDNSTQEQQQNSLQKSESKKENENNEEQKLQKNSTNRQEAYKYDEENSKYSEQEQQKKQSKQEDFEKNNYKQDDKLQRGQVSQKQSPSKINESQATNEYGQSTQYGSNVQSNRSSIQVFGEKNNDLLKPPEKSQPIKDIKDYINQEDILKKIKKTNIQNEKEYFSEYFENFKQQNEYYFPLNNYEHTQVECKQNNFMDSQMLMELEDQQIKKGSSIQMDLQHNLLKSIKSQTINQQYIPNKKNEQKLIQYSQFEQNSNVFSNNNIDLLKMVKTQSFHRKNISESYSQNQIKKQEQSEQNLQKQQGYEKITIKPKNQGQNENNKPIQQYQLQQKAPDQNGNNQKQMEKQSINKQISQQSSNSTNLITNQSNTESKNVTFPTEKDLQSVKTDDQIQIPQQRKRFEKTKAQTLSLTNGVPKGSRNDVNKDQKQIKLSPMHDLNIVNTFDTINDTISNASSINDTSAINIDTKQNGKTDNDNFIFNNMMESQILNGIKKQETYMTEDLELIMKGMDEKPVNPNTFQHSKTDFLKTDDFLIAKRNDSIYNDLNLNKSQSELIQTLAEKNQSNLISDFDRNDSRDEFQISVSSPLKPQQNSRVLQTKSTKKEINEDGKKQVNQYTLVKELGRGNCGKVKLGLDENTQKYYAIKISNKNKLSKKLISQKVSAFTLLEQEIAIMKKVDHPHIVKLHEVIEDSEENKIYLVMELMKRGSILSSSYFKATLKSEDPQKYNEYYDEKGQLKNKQNEPKSIDINKALRYMRQMSLALDYMHNFAQIVHRDIKPDNLLIDEQDNMKVADFGISSIMEETDETSSNAGTKAFMSPESWEKKSFKATPLDIWATGITLYFMIYGVVPFREKKMIDLKNEICNKEVVLPNSPEIPELAKDFLFKMLEKDPDRRITAKEMLSHPWITNNGQITLGNIIEHTLKVDKSDLEKAIGKSTKLSASFMIAIGLKRVLKRARQSIQLNGTNSLSNSTLNSVKIRLSLQNGDKNKLENLSKFQQKAYQENQDQQMNVSQILKDESFNN